MSSISDGYDKIVAMMGTAFGSHIQMTNPYEPDQNKELSLDAAWGLSMGPGVRNQRELSCRWAFDRNVTITLVRRISTLENDISAKDTAIKLLFEDQYTLLDTFESDPKLINGGTAAVDLFQSLGDNGLEFVFTDKDNFVMIRTDFQMRYQEQA